MRLQAWLLLAGATAALAQRRRSSQFGPLASRRIGEDIQGSVHVVNKNTIQLVNFKLQGQQDKVRIQVADASGQAADYTHLYLRRKTGGDEYLRPINLGNNKLIPHRSRPLVLVLRFRQNLSVFNKIQFVRPNGAVAATVPLGRTLVPESAPIPVARGFQQPGHIQYTVRATSVQVVDRRTFRINGFEFDGRRPPDGWIYGGKGTRPTRDASKGIRLMMQGLDADTSADGSSKHCAMTSHVRERFILATLPEGTSVCDLGYIGVYCYAFGEDFGHTRISTPQDCSRVQPYLPPVRGGPLPLPAPNCAKKRQRDGRGASAVDNWY